MATRLDEGGEGLALTVGKKTVTLTLDLRAERSDRDLSLIRTRRAKYLPVCLFQPSPTVTQSLAQCSCHPANSYLCCTYFVAFSPL